MKKTILTIVLAMLCLKLAIAQNTVLKAQVTDNQGKPLSGVTISLRGTSNQTKTDEQGIFILRNFQAGKTLVLSHIGYQTKELGFHQVTSTIILEASPQTLEEINIVSTGYQQLPKERATGSFTQLNSKTLNRSVGINILDRLEGVTSGLILNRGLPSSPSTSKLSIHGRSTLFSNAEPLIVLDGFPYDGSIEQINPADVQSITLLKDAAASSIWGAKSGNGVLVLTTRKGNISQTPTIGLTSTVTVSNKPNLYYIPQMNSADFIELEQLLFNKGFYNNRFNNAYNPISGAVDLFNQRKNDQISPADSAAGINTLKTQDVRRNLEQYFYRAAVYQQYQLNISGGSAQHRYYLSGGYDRNLESRIPDNYNRLSLNASNSFSLLKDKLELSADLNFISSMNNTGTDKYSPYTPYDRLADSQGNALPVVTAQTLRNAYADTAGNGQLLDWHYRPKEELSANSRERLNQYRLKGELKYNISPDLNLSTGYQYLNELTQGNLHNDLSRYTTRNLINRLSSISAGTLNRIIPAGEIFNQRNVELSSKIFRAQVNYQKTIGTAHELNAIAGYEGRDSRINSTGQTYYGYDPQTTTSANASINPTAFYPYYYDPILGARIPTSPGNSGSIEIDQSYYANFSYSYKNKYILSGSARRDESNLFGVKTNQKGVPLWSAGLAWNLSKESFYQLKWLPELKLRLTYGYNGNLDKSTSAYLALLSLGLLNEWGSEYAMISNPPNPALRWEKIKTWNLGVDFSSRNNRISGSIELYQKQATDLIGNSPTAFQTGVNQFRGNSADLQTQGLDLVLNSQNLNGNFGWNTSLLLNYNTDKVTTYKIKQSSNQNIISGNYDNPLEGYPYFAIFSYPSAGLDASGAPQGYLNGGISKDYGKITTQLDISQIKYHGSASPKQFGSIINSFNYQNFELSFNLTYKLGYYFRRTSVFSGSNYGTAEHTEFAMADYEKRWQKPGDEAFTKIPALVFPADNLQSTFFLYSQDLVEKGDHIRLQDIRFSYDLTGKLLSRSFLKKAGIFLYARNLGVLWSATKLDIDPDYKTTGIPQPFSCSFGLSLNF